MTFVTAAVIASARSAVLADFVQATAFSPTSAMPYIPRSELQERWFSRLRNEGVIKAVGPDNFYLDQNEAAHRRRRRRAAVAGVLAGFGAAVAAVLLLG